MTRLILAAAIASALVGAARADDTVTRYRGTIESRDKDLVTIRQPEGGRVQILMNPKTRLMTATDAQARDVKPESYIGVLAVPGPDGQPKPTGVTIYAPSERGFEQGRQTWDIPPGATFTAGWVDGLSPMPERRVTLRYEGGRSTFTVPQDVKFTQIVPGEKALLVPGAMVTAFVRTDPGGVLRGDLLAVGRRGAAPGL